jgi:hypothetical protein
VDGEDEHAPSTLGHSEVPRVENPEGPPIPEFPQRTEERRKVAAGMTGEESRYILEEDDGRSVSFHKGKEGIGETRPRPGETTPLAGDREVLAGEPA